MSGEHIEQRILGMLMARPELAGECPELDRQMADEDHQRVFRIIRDTKTSDLLTLAEHVSLELLDYLRELAQPHWSFNPEMFPAYVRVLGELHAERSFTGYVHRLRPRRSHANPFRSI